MIHRRIITELKERVIKNISARDWKELVCDLDKIAEMIFESIQNKDNGAFEKLGQAISELSEFIAKGEATSPISSSIANIAERLAGFAQILEQETRKRLNLLPPDSAMISDGSSLILLHKMRVELSGQSELELIRYSKLAPEDISSRLRLFMAAGLVRSYPFNSSLSSPILYGLTSVGQQLFNTRFSMNHIFLQDLPDWFSRIRNEYLASKAAQGSAILKPAPA